MNKFTRGLIGGALLLTGYFSAPLVAHAVGDWECGSWNMVAGPVALGVPFPGAAQRTCTLTETCSYTADWDGAYWHTNQPLCQ